MCAGDVLELALGQGPGVLLEVAGGDVFGIGESPRLAEGDETLEVVSVGPDGVEGEAALGREIVQEGSDLVGRPGFFA
jgi:hypothetical protein